MLGGLFGLCRWLYNNVYTSLSLRSPCCHFMLIHKSCWVLSMCFDSFLVLSFTHAYACEGVGAQSSEDTHADSITGPIAMCTYRDTEVSAAGSSCWWWWGRVRIRTLRTWAARAAVVACSVTVRRLKVLSSGVLASGENPWHWLHAQKFRMQTSAAVSLFWVELVASPL